MISKEQMTMKIFEKIVFTSDKMWVYSYDVETRQFLTLEVSCFTSSQKSTTGVHMSESNAILFSIIMNSLLKVSQDFYLAVLRCLWDAVRRKLPEMWALPSG
jgi:hypothetical protein